jgi:SAM-dependent methyltransferase
VIYRNRLSEVVILRERGLMPIERSQDPAQFSAFELSGWDKNIDGYDRAFGDVSRQTVRPLLDAAKVTDSMRVLDVCCGPGMLAAGALQRGAEAVGIDFSSEAVALAGRLVPAGSFQQADAQALPFPAASFDAVLCGYGLMHVPDPEAVLREMHRVLRPGGRAAVSVWDAGAVGFKLIYEAVKAYGTMDANLPHGPDFFQFASPQSMKAALTQAGFADCAAKSVAQDWQVDDAHEYVDAILTGTVRARAVLAAQSSGAMESVKAFLAERLEEFRGQGGHIAIPLPALVGSGAREP